MNTTRVLGALAFVGFSVVALAACGDDDDDGDDDDVPTADAGTADAGAGADAQVEPVDFDEAIHAIPGLDVSEQPSGVDGYRLFYLTYDQPVDHDHPEGQRFSQRMLLLHRDVAAPIVLGTTGYSLYVRDDSLTEPTELLNANQLMVEERYFADSRPDPTDWSYLTIRQAAADHHRIVEAFRSIYKGAWIATGASKGGMTSIYHARFHPEDLDGVVAYVAPISFGAPDTRYLPFFEQVGEATCRQAIRDFERRVLERKAQMEARVPAFATQQQLHFTISSVTGAVEGAAAGYMFGFWQYGDAGHCSKIPGADATDDELFEEIAPDIASSSDENIEFFQAYYVQASTELGYPAIPTDFLDDLLTDAESDGLPDGCCTPYSDAAMKAVAAWVTSEGSRLLLVYGQNDPWTAGKFDLGAAADSFELVAPGQNHGASIEDLEPADRAVAIDALERWTGVSAFAERVTARSRRMVVREPRVWMRR